MKPLVFHKAATSELEDAAAYYESKVVGLGGDFRAEVERACALIVEFPGAGGRFRMTNFRHLVLRRFPYAIYYQEREGFIWVAAVAHGKRRPGYWRKRQSEDVGE